MENIIKKAIEGGWKQEYKDHKLKKQYKQPHYWAEKDNVSSKIDVKYMVLDPLFWQALGKACGWEEKTRTYFCWGCNTGEVQRRHEACQCLYKETWKYHALLFYEINLTEGWKKAVEYLQKITK